MQDRLFRFRNFVAEQPISPDIALVGIDDYSIEKLGKYGSGTWVTRKPYVDQIRLAQGYYKPAVLAYDILFKEVSGEQQQTEKGISQEELLKLLVAIRKLGSNEISEIDIDTLNNMAQLTNEQGNLNLAIALSQSDGEDDTEAVAVVGAYDFAWPKEAAAATGRTWSQEAILGTDPDDLSEDNGVEIPYLRDVSIPQQFIHDVPADYRYSQNASLPSAVLLDYVRLAYINVPRDEGGVVRRIPLIHGADYSYTDPTTGEFHRRRLFVPSMALLNCLYYWGIDLAQMHANQEYLVNGKPVIEVHFGKHVIVRKPGGNTVTIPIDREGRFFLDFVCTIDEYNSVHFADIGPYKAYEQAKELLYRKIAMVGLTSTGASDVGPCPVDDNTPFVHIHMVAMSNMLTETFIRPIGAKGNGLILGVLALLVIPGAVFLRPMRYTYYLGGLALIYAVVVFTCLITNQYVMPITGPFLYIGCSYLFVLLFRYFTEEREKQRIRGMFSTMVSGDVLEYLEENPGSFSLAGQRAEATMFFSDMAGFTTISESLPPDKLVELLNQYLSPMTEIVLEYKGFIDKYEGDAIMAVWGVPYPNPDHAKLACWAALEQQVKLNDLRPAFKERFNVDVMVRMGLNSGVVSAGNMGSVKRFSYTVMGDAVNQAARFEPANKEYGTLIMIGESTYTLAKEHIEARLLDKLVVKGKTVPIQIYELIAKKGEIGADKRRVVELYLEGLRLHWERQWEPALRCFNEALTIIPDDGPSLTMKARVEEYMIVPPPENWQGEYVRTTK